MAEARLELALAPDAAPRLFRHAAIAARPRRTALAWSFHGSADGTLERLGLGVLVMRHGRGHVQQLVRTLPDADTLWLPGASMPVLARTPLAGPEPELALLAALGAIPEGLSAQGQAVLEGRAATVRTAAGVELTLLAGALRAVMAERAVARVTLAGPAAAVFALARDLAAELPLAVPWTSLGEEAAALARGGAPRPLRDGPPRIRRAATTAEAFAAAVSHLTFALLANAPAASAGETPHGTHQTRVALRRLRSVLSLFKGIAGEAGAEASQALKQLARTLGPARDWDVFLEGRFAEVAAAFAGDARIAALGEAAREVREAAYAALREALGGAAFRLLGLSLARLAHAPQEAPEPASRYASRMLNRRLRRVLGHGEDLRGLPAEALHALRLDAKRLRYAGETFAPLFGEKKARRFLRALAAVQDALGHVNDIAVAAGLLATLETAEAGRAFAIGAVEGWIAAKADGARGEAFAAWEKFLERDVFWEG